VVEKSIGLTIVGCGSAKLGLSLAKEFGCVPINKEDSTPHQKLFSLYVDPRREAYQILGLKYKNYFTCGSCLSGTWKALKQGVCKCWCMCSSGNVQQQGGVFVLDQQGDCSFSHLEDIPTDHRDPQDVLKAAGCL